MLRRTIGRYSTNALLQPLCAALLAGIIGAIAVRYELSSSLRLVAVCPCMILVPGPHVLNGMLDLAAAHIHLGQKNVAGGVSVFLCGGAKPACPGTSGTVTGTRTAADVVGPAGQGIAAGEFAELVAAMQAGFTYVNIHNAMFPSGEIRGQITED